MPAIRLRMGRSKPSFILWRIHCSGRSVPAISVAGSGSWIRLAIWTSCPRLSRLSVLAASLPGTQRAARLFHQPIKACNRGALVQGSCDMLRICVAIWLSFVRVFAAGSTGELFTARALTEPGGFTTGIEGPACDVQGNIYAVNFARQQTIGKVTPEGKAMVWIELPGKSTGNGIRF